MEIELLGAPGVRTGGERSSLTGRQPALLAALALAAPRPISSDRLLEAVWGEQLPRDPANALQQRISALRKVVDPDRTGTVLVTAGGGYALRVDAAAIDARRAEQLGDEARALLAAGDAAAARRVFEEALRLWQGPPLDGVADEPWAVAEAQRLRELHLAVSEGRAEAALAAGAGPELIAELTDQLAATPLRERVAGQLMRALYRAGRQADALDVYERTRAALAEELGVDPGPELRRLHLQVLEQAAALDAAGPATSSPPDGATLGHGSVAGNLPAATSSVVGRDQDLERVARLLTASRLVTLTGPGGAGKTTLALAAGREQTPREGVWLVELAPLSDGAGVVEAIADALGLPRGGFGATGLDAAGLARSLGERELLLVLDNCEHVVEAAAEVTERLLSGAPQLRVLATSREALGVGGELVWSVPTLGLPDAAATDPAAITAAPAIILLLDRLRAHTPDLELDADGAAAAAAIVRRLDGIPLAIELAAARGRILSLTELAAQLDDRFTLLTSRSRTAPSRQRTLRGALQWSWDLLDEPLQRAWAALSVPVGRFTADTASRLLPAAAVMDAPLDVLTDLVDRSLLSADTSRSTTRYRMLETVRAYAHGRLAELGIGDAVRSAHAKLVHDALEACHDRRDPAAFDVDLPGLASWLDEARAAMTWAATTDPRRLQSIAAALGWAWLLRGLVPEGLTWLDRGLGASDGAPPSGLQASDVDGRALLWASALRATAATPHARAWADLSLEADLTDAERVLASVFAAVHDAHLGAVEDAATALERALALATPIGGWPLGFTHLITAQMARLTGHIDAARDHARAALELLAAADVAWARVQAIDIAIDDLDARGEHAAAFELASTGLALCRDQGLPELEARMLLQRGVARHELGDVEEARTDLDDAVALSATAGRSPSLGFALLVAGSHARRRGELPAAQAQLEEARQLLGGTGTAYGPAWATIELAHTLASADDAASARSLAGDGLAQALAIGDPTLLARGLCATVVAAVGNDDAEVAAAALGVLDALCRTSGLTLPADAQRELATHAATAAALLGDHHEHVRHAAAASAADDVGAAVTRLQRQLGATG